MFGLPNPQIILPSSHRPFLWHISHKIIPINHLQKSLHAARQNIRHNIFNNNFHQYSHGHHQKLQCSLGQFLSIWGASKWTDVADYQSSIGLYHGYCQTCGFESGSLWNIQVQLVQYRAIFDNRHCLSLSSHLDIAYYGHLHDLQIFCKYWEQSDDQYFLFQLFDFVLPWKQSNIQEPLH